MNYITNNITVNGIEYTILYNPQKYYFIWTEIKK